MAAIDLLEAKVRALYEAKDPSRNDWADWLYAHHVFEVVRFARELAEDVGANSDLSRAAAVLHDIADVRMKRTDPRHAEASLKLARELMHEVGFNDNDVAIVVDDAIKLHSCRDGVVPQTREGKVLATADAMAHLKTDFYAYATWVLAREMTFEQVKDWVIRKVSRDFDEKIQFDAVRERLKPNYDVIMGLFVR